MSETVEIIVVCRICYTRHNIKADAKKYHSWNNGEGYIQDILPELSAGDRELLISATCDDCFSKMFPYSESSEDQQNQQD